MKLQELMRIQLECLKEEDPVKQNEEQRKVTDTTEAKAEVKKLVL